MPLNHPYLAERRPDFVTKQTDRAFQHANKQLPDSSTTYVLFGNDPDYYWHDLEVKSSELFENVNSVLDLGCGAAEVIKQFMGQGTGKRSLGITARDYTRGANPYVVVGDVQNLHQVIPNEDYYEVVLAKLLLQHLRDPFAALEIALAHVAVGGLFVSSNFTVDAAHHLDTAKTVVRNIMSSGIFSFEGRTTKALGEIAEAKKPSLPYAIPDMMLRRLNRGTFRFSLDYELLPKTRYGWRYVPHT